MYARFMRTTISFDEATLTQAKKRAVRAGRSLSEWVADVVRRELSAVPTREPATLPLLPEGNGLQPGIDLFDGSALADLMDSDADS